ncbi:outer membrane usher protein PefC [Salmonella enterica subsp. diarizonae]|uniref:Outer membrane usher protein PefC n=1 Tax=Salmonella diarizonae TaxID=59204 RepID=A0A5Y3W9D1_SALDZ|nr:outer membrane usher protein PefC [Salmonella enterica subsp. diarizonae]EBG1930933.1 outer membrane usher protein PefC [Salmonella enterica]EBZ8403921.1 outer membrane usher protein PefC [Salmonella enterica subsp. enterica serovar Muenchen]ECF1925566.1 outer membrane usher protein PefC [Salmonella enterica subsp. enterica serovar Newport]EBI1480274.1 outer membrane usher protein PefC [Salmonella enterica]
MMQNRYRCVNDESTKKKMKDTFMLSGVNWRRLSELNIRFLSRITLSGVITGIITSCLMAEAAELNLSFIHGTDREHAPAILKDGTLFPPGQYVVDVFLNKQKTARQVLNIGQNEMQALCFTPEWIQQAHLLLNLDMFKEQYDSVRECYQLGSYPAASVSFDYGTQSLYISEPQITLRTAEAGEDWDYGIPGFRLRYASNASRSQRSRTVYYGNVDMSANAGRWVLSGSTSGFSGRGFESPQAMASTVIAPLRGNLELGKTRTRSTLMSDFSFYGASLRSDSSIIPWSARGYAPVISGVAGSNARITVSQGGYTLASQVVPPGEYLLNDLSPIGNGDLTVTVEEEDGRRTVRTYPVTTLPTLLRAGDFNYNLSVGTRNDDSQAKGVFVAGSLDYGFAPLTLNLATILHRQYQGAGIGLSRNMGAPGALEVSVNVSRSTFDKHEPFYLRRTPEPEELNDPEKQALNARNDWLWHSYGQGRVASGPQTGLSATVKYAKSLGQRTNLHLLTWRYTGEKYVDFSGFDPHQVWRNENRKERYEAVISHALGGGYLNFSGWTQSYRNRSSNDSGANASYSTSLGPASLGFYLSYSHTPWNPGDYSLSMNVSMPFSVGSRQQYSSTGVNYRPHGGTQVNTSVSGNPTTDMNYNISAGAGQNSRSTSASVGYSMDMIQTGASLTQSRYSYGHYSNSQTSGSLSASGSVLGTLESGLLFTREQSGTVAVVKIKDIPGVTFNGSRPTGRHGVTAVPLSEYSRNDIRINPENVPDDMELLDTVRSVVPTRQAIVYREFSYTQVKRYVLKINGTDGKPLPQGSTAVTQNGLDAGFVTGGGVLLATLLAEPESLTVTTPQGTQCRVNMKGVNPEAGKLSEVHCE